ncbi:DUF4270 family protein [Marinilabiliaceae bacterium JC017]|nr:DUF4270 family protein [Marinilabiliaceae bacterium JC017]
MNKLIHMKILNINKGQSFVIGLISLLLMVSCKDEPADMGLGILPPGDFISANYYNETPFTNINSTKEIIRSDDPPYGIIGEINDPKFGYTKADFLTEVMPTADPGEGAFNQGADYFLDSLNLDLVYNFNWWYGDMFAKHQINLYELTKTLTPGDKYYSNMDLANYYNPNTPVATKLAYVNDDVADSVWRKGPDEIWTHPDSLWKSPAYLWDLSKTEGDLKTHKWSFKLSDELAEKIFNIDEESLKSRDAFRNYFNGFYITSDLDGGSELGSLLRLNLLSSSSKMTLHYHYFSRDDNNKVTDTIAKTYDFSINTEAVRINRFKHDFQNKIDFENEKVEQLYIQGMAGSHAKIDFSDELMNWRDSIEQGETYNKNIFANIEFFFEVDTIASDFERYPPPSNLSILKKILKDGEIKYEVPTFDSKISSIDQPVFSGGDIIGDMYRFYLNAEYLEKVLNADDFNKEEAAKNFQDLYLAPQLPEGNFNRVILKSNNAKDKPLQLKIKYVKYE